MNGIPARRRSWLIAALALVLAAAVIYLVSRPARPTAGPAPASALQPTASSVASAAPVPSASARPPATAPPAVANSPAQSASPPRSSGAVEADHVFVVPTPPPGPAPAATTSAPRRCQQWRGEASDEHAAALLLAARQNDGGAEVPSPRVVRAYRLAITTACARPDRADDNVADVARVVYETDRDRWGI